MLTESSTRKLRHGATNQLGGRLVAVELGEGFTLARALDRPDAPGVEFVMNGPKPF